MEGYEDLPPAKKQSASVDSGGYEDLPFSKTSEPVVDKPKTYTMFSPPPDPKQEAAGYGEALKGMASGAGQTYTGIAELLPGEAGATAARATQLLKEFGSPEAQFAGGLVAPLPLAKLLRGSKTTQEAQELLTRGKQAFESAKTGMLAGGIYGVAAPTGIEDTLKRYKEKGFTALKSIPFGDFWEAFLAA